MNKFVSPSFWNGAALGVFIIIVLIGMFQIGQYVGYAKARHSYAWGANYQKNFIGDSNNPLHRFRRDFFGDDFRKGHGVAGKILSFSSTSFVIKGSDNAESVISVADTTTITSRRARLSLKDLRVDDYVVVIGVPTVDGVIDAKFIRRMPLSSNDDSGQK